MCVYIWAEIPLLYFYIKSHNPAANKENKTTSSEKKTCFTTNNNART